MVKEFRLLGYDAQGVDVIPGCITYSVDKEHCHLVETTARLNYPDHYFDLVVSREALEHIKKDELELAIPEWKRVSKNKMVHIIAVSERGESATGDPAHFNVEPEAWWANKFKQFGYKTTFRPNKYFFSPLGSAGYMLIEKINI